MIVQNSVNTGGFLYCNLYVGPHQTGEYLNDGTGHYHQAAYIIEGDGTATSSAEKPPLPRETSHLTTGLFVDLSHSRGANTDIKTYETGTSMMFFNPIPDTRELDIVIAKGKDTQTLQLTPQDGIRTVIVSIVGTAIANSKELKASQYAIVSKPVSIQLEPTGVIAIVKHSR